MIGFFYFLSFENFREMTIDDPINNEQVILVTGGYDHTIKIWQPHTGACQRTAQHADSVSFKNYKKNKINDAPLTHNLYYIIQNYMCSNGIIFV